MFVIRSGYAISLAGKDKRANTVVCLLYAWSTLEINLLKKKKKHKWSCSEILNDTHNEFNIFQDNRDTVNWNYIYISLVSLMSDSQNNLKEVLLRNSLSHIFPYIDIFFLFIDIHTV